MKLSDDEFYQRFECQQTYIARLIEEITKTADEITVCKYSS